MFSKRFRPQEDVCHCPWAIYIRHVYFVLDWVGHDQGFKVSLIGCTCIFGRKVSSYSTRNTSYCLRDFGCYAGGPVFRVCGRERLIPVYSATETSLNIEIRVFHVATWHNILSRKLTTGTQMGLRNCPDWSASVLFAFSKVGSSHEEAQNFINGYANSEGLVEPVQMCSILLDGRDGFLGDEFARMRYVA